MRRQGNVKISWRVARSGGFSHPGAPARRTEVRLPGSRLKSAYPGVRPELGIRSGNPRGLDDRMTKAYPSDEASVAVGASGRPKVCS